MTTIALTCGVLGAEEPDRASCRFGEAQWKQSEWTFIKRRDMAGRSEWRQRAEYIENDGNHTSMIYGKPRKGDMTVSATMVFVDRMAPAIVIVSKIGEDAQGAKVFDEHVEITVWDEGVNVWRLHTVDGKSKWEKTAFAKFKLAKDTRYTLRVTKKGKELTIDIDGHIFGCLDDSLTDECHVGITACEGVNRFYDFTVESVRSK